MPVAIENLERDIALIKKEREGSGIRMASEQPLIKKIPLDSPGLMRITSGGIPIGRVTRLWGSPSSGKSLTALEIVKCAQAIMDINFMSGLLCAYWDIEGAFVKEFAQERGVDVSALVYQDADIIEDVAKELQLLLGSVHVHVIDSCSDGKPRERMAADVDEQGAMNLKIRTWEKAFEYITNAMSKSENAIITVDHETSTFSGKGQPKAKKAVGGKEMEHHSGLSIHFVRGAYLYYDEYEMLQTEEKLKEKATMGIAGSKEADGVEIHAKVNKSRVCRPLRSTTMRLDLNSMTFDRTFELMDAAMYFDKQGGIAHRTGQPALAAKSGTWFTLPNGEKAQGERQLRIKINENEEYRKEIMKAMLAGN